MNEKLPYIFIFDIDNCIIGNVEYPLIEADLFDILKHICKKNNITNKCNYDNYINFVNILKKGLLRPYFKEFIKFIKKKYKNVEIYVYTNSSYSWTYGGLVYNIEKASNIKFNKPYFTREYSLNNNKKSLGRVFEVIIQNLNKKYPLLNNKKYIKKVFNNNIIFIDNIKDNLEDYPKKQLTCPEYNNSIPYNIIKKLKNKYNLTNKILNNYLVLEFLDKYSIPLYSNNKKASLKQNNKLLQKYLWLYISKNDSIKNKKDKFFKNIINIIKKDNKNKLNNNYIKKLNYEINNNKKN